MKHSPLIFAVAAVLTLVTLRAQEHDHSPPTMDEKSANALNSTTHAMSEGHHMDMSPPMRMTTLRPPAPEDQKRADRVAAASRAALEKYKDYKAALADSFHPFLPNAKGQRMVHFTNYFYAAEAALRFNPAHPTSLLYEKQGDGYKLIGAMYTAPALLNEDELDKRIPLSVAQWHMHVNLCVPPRERRQEAQPPTLASAFRAPSPPKRSARPRAVTSCPASSVGWFICTPTSRPRKTSGRSSASAPANRTTTSFQIVIWFLGL